MNREGFDDFYAEYSPEYVLSLIDNGENLWYPLINPSQYKRALEEFVKYGQFMRFPTDLIYSWMEIIMKNTVIIDRITEFAGHTSFMPVEAVRDYFGMDDEKWEAYKQKLIDEEAQLPSELYGEYVDTDVSDEAICFKLLEEKGIYDKCQLPDGSDGWSDYGLKPLYDVIWEYHPDTSTPEQTIVLINKALDVTHQRGDLPSAFIQGGSESLTRITNESVEMNDEVLDVYGNELQKKLTIYDNGELIGYTDYSVYDEKPYIQMIEVQPKYRRKGYASQMIKRIQRTYPDSEIDFGWTTDEGTKFIEKLPKRIVKSGAYTRKLNRAKELKKWLDEFATHTKEDMTDEDIEFVRQHTEEWQKIHWEYRDLINWLDEHKPQKVFIKTNESQHDQIEEGVEEPLYEEAKQYYFVGKCNDTDDGNQVQDITHWDEFNYGKYAGIPAGDEDIEIVDTDVFLELIGDEPRPHIIEYCAKNKKYDIMWAYDSMGIHWFYNTTGNYIFETQLNEELIDAKSKGQGDLYNLVLKNPSMQELDKYDQDAWRVIVTKDGNFWFGESMSWVHDDMLDYLVNKQGYPWTCEVARLVVLPDVNSYMICIVVNAFEENLDGDRRQRTEEEIQEEYNEKKQLLMNCEYIKKYVKRPVYILDRRDEEAEDYV